MSLKELKKNRLSPAEKWLLELIDGVKPKTDSSGDIYWYNEDGNWLFTQDFENGFLVVRYHSIWLVLAKEFGLNGDEIIELLTNILYDYTDNGKLMIY